MVARKSSAQCVQGYSAATPATRCAAAAASSALGASGYHAAVVWSSQILCAGVGAEGIASEKDINVGVYNIT